MYQSEVIDVVSSYRASGERPACCRAAARMHEITRACCRGRVPWKWMMCVCTVASHHTPIHQPAGLLWTTLALRRWHGTEGDAL
eukprot:362932-Chlamydomonas_euryale.AAC.10